MQLAIALTVISTLLVLSNASYYPHYSGGQGMYQGNYGYGYGNVDHLASWTQQAIQYVVSLLPPDATDEQQELVKQVTVRLEQCLRHLTAHHVGAYKHCLNFYRNKAAAALMRMSHLSGLLENAPTLGSFPFP